MTNTAERIPTPYEVIKPGIFNLENVEFYTVLVDGEMARRVLELYNLTPETGKAGTNRRPSRVRKDLYKKEIVEGRWGWNPQPIVLSAPGPDGQREELADGQNRLLAIAEAADEYVHFKPVPVTFCLGVPQDAKWIMDLVNPRKPGDFLAMQGEPNPARMASALKMHYAYTKVPFVNINTWQAVKLSPTQQKSYLEDNKVLRQGMDEARKLRTQLVQNVVAVFYALMTEQHGPFKTAEFLDGLEKGLKDGMKLDDARWVLREYLASQRGRYKWNGFEQLALLIYAANDWLLGANKFSASSAHTRLHRQTKFPQLLTAKELPENAFLL